MSRRGRCQCGTILVFERTAQGYKVRCSGCQAVVRLRPDEAKRSPPPRQTPPPPPPVLTETTDHHTPELPLEVGSLDILDLNESSAPIAMVEMEVYQEPKNASRGGLWLLVGLAVVGVALAAGSIALVLSNPS